VAGGRYSSCTGHLADEWSMTRALVRDGKLRLRPPPGAIGAGGLYLPRR
jgi:hypothetical protein